MEREGSVYEVFIVLWFLPIARFIERHTMHLMLQMGKKLKEENNMKVFSVLQNNVRAPDFSKLDWSFTGGLNSVLQKQIFSFGVLKMTMKMTL